MAKRLMDYGFHAPTMSFPVPGTLMIEPTESESQGGARPLLRRDDRHPRRDRGDRARPGRPREDNLLKNAPHTADVLPARLDRTPTPRRRPPSGAGPREAKFWPPVGRIDNVYGDRHLSAPARRSRAIATPPTRFLAEEGVQSAGRAGLPGDRRSCGAKRRRAGLCPISPLQSRMAAPALPLAGGHVGRAAVGQVRRSRRAAVALPWT